MFGCDGGVVGYKWCLACISGIGAFDFSVDEPDFISRKEERVARTVKQNKQKNRGDIPMRRCTVSLGYFFLPFTLHSFQRNTHI